MHHPTSLAPSWGSTTADGATPRPAGVRRAGPRAWLWGLGLSASLLMPAQALELNQASEAELDSLLGVGPSLSSRLLQARQQGPFKDWRDLIQRVPGIGPRSARKLSAQGATVDGLSLDGMPPSTAERQNE